MLHGVYLRMVPGGGIGYANEKKNEKKKKRSSFVPEYGRGKVRGRFGGLGGFWVLGFWVLMTQSECGFLASSVFASQSYVTVFFLGRRGGVGIFEVKRLE